MNKKETIIIGKVNNSESKKKFLTLIKFYKDNIITKIEFLSAIYSILNEHKSKNSYDALSIININVFFTLMVIGNKELFNNDN